MKKVNTNEESIGYKIWGADDVVYGPVELPVMVEWIQDERVTADTWVYVEQSDAWHKAPQVPELSLFFRSRSGAAGGAPASGTPQLVGGIKPGMLRRVKILGDMSDANLATFIQFMEVQKIRQFSEVVKQGEHGDAMFLVLEGEVRVRQMIAGKETILATLAAGEFFGDISLFDQGPRSADVVANNDSVLLKVSTTAFQRLTAEAPALATPLLVGICKTLTARIRADNKRFRDSINFARASANR